MKPDVFVGPNFLPSIFNMIKHSEYWILSIPDNIFGPIRKIQCNLTSQYQTTSVGQKIKMVTASNIAFSFEQMNYTEYAKLLFDIPVVFPNTRVSRASCVCLNY